MYCYILSSRHPGQPAERTEHLWQSDSSHLALALSYDAINSPLRVPVSLHLQQRAWMRNLNSIPNLSMVKIRLRQSWSGRKLLRKTSVVYRRKAHIGLTAHFYLFHLQSMQVVTTCVTLSPSLSLSGEKSMKYFYALCTMLSLIVTKLKKRGGRATYVIVSPCNSDFKSGKHCRRRWKVLAFLQVSLGSLQG